MKRAAALVVTAFLFGCGAETSGGGSTANDPPGLPVDIRTGSVGFNRVLTAGVTKAKVVLKTTTSKETPVLECDDVSGVCASFPCTPAGGECAAHPGSSCGAGGFCVVTTSTSGIFYVMNVSAPSTSSFTLPVPCDGRTYTAEVYAATSAGSVLQIADAYRAPSIVVSDTCATTTAPVWAPVAPPSLSVPTIYAGLPAPYDAYTVGVNGLVYPFAPNFTMTSAQGTSPAVAARSYSGGGAVFASPTTNDPVDFVATFSLDRSILSSSEAPWQLNVQGEGIPTGSTLVTGP